MKLTRLLCAALTVIIVCTGCTARPQSSEPSGRRRENPPAAVYLAPQSGAQLASSDLAAHPEIAVVHTMAELESAAVTRTPIWIDKSVVDAVAPEWVAGRVEERYPLVVIGYGSPDYAFRVAVPVLPGNPGGLFFLREAGRLRRVQGSSAYMITSEKKTTTSYGQTMYLEGFETTPTVTGILKLSGEILRMPYR